MNKSKLTTKGLIGKISALILLLSTTSCSKDKDGTISGSATAEVQLKSNAALGNILTDKDGRTLYYFANDATKANNCTGGCELLWPVFNIADFTKDKVGQGLEFSDFTPITTSSGKTQLAFKGRPLYYYAPLINGTNTKEAPGQAGGENFNGVWFVAKPDYTIMLTNAQLIGHNGTNYTQTYVEGTGKTLYFTDAKGITLYTFKNDRQNKNNFTAADFSNNGVWPIYETDKVVVPSALDKSLFGAITVSGRKQLTYKGWPLYHFGQDNMVMGSNKGVSFPMPGGIWPVGVKDMSPAMP